MKILLTAPPRTGKSTIIEKFIKDYDGKKIGILAKEIRNNENERIGFKSINLKNEEKLFMHVNAIDSDVIIGNKYKVDIKAIDDFVVAEIGQPVDNDIVIIVDEIGKAQSYSTVFLKTINELLDSDKNLLMTIVYDDEVWAREYKEHEKAILIEVTMENRDDMPNILIEVFKNIESYELLNEEQKIFVDNEFKNFIKNTELDRAKKLFKNAIPYFVSKKFEKIDENKYIVNGSTDVHHVTLGEEVKCDCKLFNGIGKFEGKPSYCSHIDTIRISRV